MNTQEALEEKTEQELGRIYRLLMTLFGVGMSALLIAGFVLAVHWVDKHDRQVQQTARRSDPPRQSLRDPLQEAVQVQFELPYLHGADPQTLQIMAELARGRSGDLPGGFRIPAQYQTAVTRQQTELSLFCQGICRLSFRLPVAQVLLPWRNGRRWIYPARNYTLKSGTVRLEVQNSRLAGLARQEESLALFNFSVDLRSAYRERYFKADGSEIPL